MKIFSLLACLYGAANFNFSVKPSRGYLKALIPEIYMVIVHSVNLAYYVDISERLHSKGFSLGMSWSVPNEP